MWNIASSVRGFAWCSLGYWKDDHDDCMQLLKGIRPQQDVIANPRVLASFHIPSGSILMWVNSEGWLTTFHFFPSDKHCTSINVCSSSVKLLPDFTVKTMSVQMCQTSLSLLSLQFIWRWLLIHLLQHLVKVYVPKKKCSFASRIKHYGMTQRKKLLSWVGIQQFIYLFIFVLLWSQVLQTSPSWSLLLLHFHLVFQDHSPSKSRTLYLWCAPPKCFHCLDIITTSNIYMQYALILCICMLLFLSQTSNLSSILW